MDNRSFELEKQAKELSETMSQKYPEHSIRFNPDAGDVGTGVFEILYRGQVHYTRESADQVKQLMG